MDWKQMLPLMIPIVVPLVIAGLKWAIGRIPGRLLPILAPILGGLLDAGLAYLTGNAANPLLGGLLGSAGVGVREIKDQLFPAVKPAGS